MHAILLVHRPIGSGCYPGPDLERALLFAIALDADCDAPHGEAAVRAECAQLEVVELNLPGSQCAAITAGFGCGGDLEDGAAALADCGCADPELLEILEAENLELAGARKGGPWRAWLLARAAGLPCGERPVLKEPHPEPRPQPAPPPRRPLTQDQKAKHLMAVGALYARLHHRPVGDGRAMLDEVVRHLAAGGTPEDLLEDPPSAASAPMPVSEVA